jgi:hypothetical protein
MPNTLPNSGIMRIKVSFNISNLLKASAPVADSIVPNMLNFRILPGPSTGIEKPDDTWFHSKPLIVKRGQMFDFIGTLPGTVGEDRYGLTASILAFWKLL